MNARLRGCACIAVACLSTGSVVSAAAIPALKEGMPYGAARSAVLAKGWQAKFENPMRKDRLQYGLQEWFIGNRFLEVESCLPAGLGTCTAVFRDERGRRLYLFTSDPSEDAPNLVSWCVGRPDPACRSGRRQYRELRLFEGQVPHL